MIDKFIGIVPSDEEYKKLSDDLKQLIVKLDNSVPINKVDIDYLKSRIDEIIKKNES